MSIPVFSILASANAAAAAGPPPLVTFAPIVAIIGVFYFLVLRPQSAQRKDHAAKLDALKKGDQVLTGGGLIAKVVSVDGDYCTLEIAPGTKARALKSTIVDVIPPGGAAND